MMPTSGKNYLNWLTWSVAALVGVAAAVEFILPNLAIPLDAVIVLLAASASVATLNKQLPLQNVLLAAALTAFIGSVAHGLSERTGIPFGPLTFSDPAGPKLFNFVPWPVPLLWIIAIFNSRGVARLILRPWRRVKNYGFRLIALTVALALAFDLALEPFAAAVKHFWRWQPTKIAVTWHGASPVAFLVWACVSLLIVVVITPSLIRKQPGSQPPPDYVPVALWFGGVALFAVGAAQTGLWLAVAVDAILVGVGAVFCWRGAKW